MHSSSKGMRPLSRGEGTDIGLSDGGKTMIKALRYQYHAFKCSGSLSTRQLKLLLVRSPGAPRASVRSSRFLGGGDLPTGRRSPSRKIGSV